MEGRGWGPTGQRDSGVALVPRGLSLLAPWGGLGRKGSSGESGKGGLHTSAPHTGPSLGHVPGQGSVKPTLAEGRGPRAFLPAARREFWGEHHR